MSVTEIPLKQDQRAKGWKLQLKISKNGWELRQISPWRFVVGHLTGRPARSEERGRTCGTQPIRVAIATDGSRLQRPEPPDSTLERFGPAAAAPSRCGLSCQCPKTISIENWVILTAESEYELEMSKFLHPSVSNYDETQPNPEKHIMATCQDREWAMMLRTMFYPMESFCQ